MRIFRKNTGAIAAQKTTPPSQAFAQTGSKTGKAADGRRTVRLASVVIAVTFQRLIDDAYREWSLEEALVLQALRRSTQALESADTDEIAEYVRSRSPEQLRGVASNVKGIYHELLFVQAENADWDSVAAEVKEFTNHPGGDVEFIVDGNVVGEVQLEAVASEADVLVTRPPGSGPR